MKSTLEMFVIAARDGARAKEFYEQLFNWTIIDAGPLLQIKGAGLSGHILKWPHQNHPTHVSFYVNVENIQACLAKVEEMGGTVILAEMKVPVGGSIAQFTDPDGHIVGVYHGEHHQTEPGKDNNQLFFFEIAAREGQRSKAFYESVFDWRISDDGHVMSISAEDAGMDGLIFNWTREEPPYLTVYLKVTDVTAYLEKAVQLGGKIIVPETAIPNFGTFGQFLDLDGNLIGIYNG